MAASRVPATLKRLHELWTSTFAADKTINVWLGQVATGDPTDALWVGWDGNPDGDDQMATSRTAWAGIGAKRRDEDIAIVCSICVLQGIGSDAGGVQAAIDRVYAQHTVAEDALRADPSLGQGPPFVAACSTGELYMHPQTDQGLLARLVFAVTVQTRN